MVTYKYTAMSREGVKVSGVTKAVDEYMAADKIKATYPIVVSIEEVKDTAWNKLMNMEVGGKVDAKALSIMCSQFSIVLDSGVSIDECLKMIAAQTKDKHLKKMLELSAEDVSQGSGIADSFEKNYPAMPITFLETVRAGEVSGTLGDSFASLANFYESSYKFQAKVKSAMSYPVFVLLVAVVVLIVIMAFVMPKFTAMFADLGGEIPGITKALMNTSDFFAAYWPVMIAVMAITFVFYKVYSSTEQGKINIAKLMLKAPVVGNLNVLQGATEFSTTMCTLLKAGLTVGDALNITSKVMGNYVLSLDIKRMEEKLKTGAELGSVMRANEYFPQVLKEMTAVGEKTGELEATLDTISKYYNQEYDYAVNKVVSKIEPFMLIFLALFAGFIVIALYLPMFTMYDMM